MTDVDQKNRVPATWGQATPQIQAICEANGLSDDEIDSAIEIELFSHVISDLGPIEQFKNLKYLKCIQQDFLSLAPLQHCPNLEKIWVVECPVSRIQGLDACVKLKELYLTSLSLSCIECLEPLTHLTKIWLNDNRITSLSGLRTLTSLKQLWIARNRIEDVEGHLQYLSQLEDLNLADNLIGSFQQIPTFARLPNLRVLTLEDAHFGDNPCCRLCNYQTYTLFHLRHLKVLDTRIVTDEARHLAESTFMKKKMYYNMRIKVLKRHATTVIRRGGEARKSKLQHMRALFGRLAWQKKNAERMIHDLTDESAFDATGDSADESDSQLTEKVRMLEAAIVQKRREIDRVGMLFEGIQKRVQSSIDFSIRRMLVELESGGNIRIEEGNADAVWYSSCIELVRSRLFPHDYAKFDVGDIKVLNVWRIHHRYLRNRFEEKLESLVDTSNPSYKRFLEYLFYADPPDAPKDEILRVMECGFRNPEFYMRSMGLDAAVPMANSVPGAEMPRLMADQALSRPGSATGRLIVSKVFLGKCTQDSKPRPVGANGRLSNASSRSSYGMGRVPAESVGDLTLPGVVTKADYPEHNAVFRNVGQDGKQRMWMIFDHILCLPEYFVEFEYVPCGAAGLGVGGMVRSPSKPLTSPISLHDTQTSVAAASIGVPSLPVSVPDIAGGVVANQVLAAFIVQCAAVGSRDESTTEALSAPPTLPPRPKAYVLTQDVILRAAHLADDPAVLLALANSADQADRSSQHDNPSNEENDTKDVVGSTQGVPPGIPTEPTLRMILSSVTYLNLGGLGLQRLEGLTSLTGLKRLVLPFNEIQRLEGVSGLRSLEMLDASFNAIRKLEPSCLLGLPMLTTLDLEHNVIARVDDLACLNDNGVVPALRDLRLRSNVVADERTYREAVIDMVPRISVLDDKPVTDHERDRAKKGGATITEVVILVHGCTRPRYSASLVGPPGTGASGTGRHHKTKSQSSSLGGSLGQLGLAVPITPPPDAPKNTFHDSASSVVQGTLLDIVDLELDHLGIRTIRNLEQCLHLRRLSLCDNNIVRIGGLDSLTKLDHIALEENRISRIEGLSALISLRTLDLGKNVIQRIEKLGTLTRLIQLSLEDNMISSLAGLTSLVSLMELYLGNNKVAETYEVLKLKPLHKLVILDLSGNPLTEDQQYRLYTIYHLRGLKVLDGHGVEGTEHLASRERYAGRLTVDLLSEKLGQRKFTNVRELSLPGCRIREVDQLDPEVFPSLRSVTLSNNLLTSMEGLIRLSSLQTLDMSQNRIETFRQSIPSALKDLVSLEVLDLSNNCIRDLSVFHLTQLTSLRVLRLSGNELTKIDCLAGDGLQRLEELVVDECRVRQLDPVLFPSLLSLVSLSMQNCIIRTLSGLESRSLKVVHLNGNRVTDMNQLDKMNLPAAVTVNMSGNPVARKPHYRVVLVKNLPTVQVIDGRPVSTDDRERALMLDDDPSAVSAAQAPSYVDRAGPVSRVSLKLSSVSFDSMGSLQPQSRSGSRGSADSSRMSASGRTIPTSTSFRGRAQERERAGRPGQVRQPSVEEGKPGIGGRSASVGGDSSSTSTGRVPLYMANTRASAGSATAHSTSQAIQRDARGRIPVSDSALPTKVEAESDPPKPVHYLPPPRVASLSQPRPRPAPTINRDPPPSSRSRPAPSPYATQPYRLVTQHRRR